MARFCNKDFKAANPKNLKATRLTDFKATILKNLKETRLKNLKATNPKKSEAKRIFHSWVFCEGRKEVRALLTLLSLWRADTRVSLKDHFPGWCFLFHTSISIWYVSQIFTSKVLSTSQTPSRAANGYQGGDKLRDACHNLYQALETKVLPFPNLWKSSDCKNKSCMPQNSVAPSSDRSSLRKSEPV